KQRREAAAVQLAAAFIKSDQAGIPWQRLQQEARFSFFQGRGRQWPALFHFLDAQGTQRAALQPLGIVGEQGPEGTAAQAAHGQQGQAHSASSKFTSPSRLLSLREAPSRRNPHGPRRYGRAPHLLKVVEFPDFWTEDVDDDIAGVKKHPI